MLVQTRHDSKSGQILSACRYGKKIVEDSQCLLQYKQFKKYIFKKVLSKLFYIRLYVVKTRFSRILLKTRIAGFFDQVKS